MGVSKNLNAIPRSPTDVSGTSDFSPAGEVRRKPFAPEGQAPFFITPFAPGSTLTLEFDSNGDGMRGDVTIVASDLRVRAAFPEFREGLSITTDIVGELTGGVGTIIDYGDDYPWDEWISWSAPASYSVTGTWECFGPWCEANGFATGEPLPYEELLAIHAATVVPSISLGSWQLYGGAQNSFASVCQDDYPPACHVFAALETEVGADPWSTGMWLRGRAVPEPSATLVVAAALAALALRRGTSGTIRRHEAC